MVIGSLVKYSVRESIVGSIFESVGDLVDNSVDGLVWWGPFNLIWNSVEDIISEYENR